MEMQKIILKPRENYKIPIEAENITPDKLAGLNRDEITAITAWWGNQKTTLGELFHIEVEGRDEPPGTQIIIDGDASRIKRIGEAMTAGSILIKGSVDMHLGAKMKGGAITVEGNADSWLGREMRGGEILVKGDAGYYVGSGYRGEACGMRGGRITINGNARDYLGEHMCGGEILVKGDTGIMAGISNNGGKITIYGNTSLPGPEMKKGTIIIKGDVPEMVPVFKQEEDTELEDGTYTKYTGDVVVKGKGELYIKK